MSSNGESTSSPSTSSRWSASGAAPRPSSLVRLLGRALKLVWTSGPRITARLGVLTLVQALATVAQLAIIGRLVREVQRLSSGIGSFGDALPEIVAFGCAFAIQTSAGIWMSETRVVLGELTTRHAQSEIASAAKRAPLIDFDRPAFHDLLTRALRSGAARPLQVTSSISTIATALVLCIALVITLIIIEPAVLLVLLVGGIPAWLLTRRVTRIGYRFAVDETEPDRRRAYLLYLLTSRQTAAELRAFQLGDHVNERHHTLWTGRIERIRRVARERGLYGTAGRIVNAIAIALIVAVLVWTVAEGRSDIGAAATAAGAVAILGQRLTALLSGIGVLYECGLFLSDVDEFARLYPAAADSDPTPAVIEFEPGGTLLAEHLAFTYPTGTTPAVTDVSIEVGPGEVIALVGPNGSGKTTVAKMLAGLLDPVLGSITWSSPDGEATTVIRSGTTTWHDNVAVVFQDFCRYMLPLRDNVALGRVDSDLSDTDVIAALQQVGLAGLPDGLDDGLDTGLGPEYAESTDLSGGQWQRVAIARALFRDAPVVILDEPSAALDPHAEAELFDAVAELSKGRSIVVVSHRLATVTKADRIYVLEHGEVAESGNHNSLMAIDGRYAEMFRLQADRFTAPSAPDP